MNVLAFDTCLDACSAAVLVGSGGSRPVSAFEPMATGQAERLVPMIDELMAEAGLTFPELDRIAVTVGPGTFTGTRIAIAAVRALALSTKVVVVSTTSLAVIAERAVRHLTEPPDATDIAVAIDARRDQVYWQRFARSGGLAPRSEPQVLSPEEAAQQCASAPHLIVGSGAESVAGLSVAKHVVLPAITLPRAEDLAAMAPSLSPTGEPPAPLYLRPADAKPQTGKSIARAPT